MQNEKMTAGPQGVLCESAPQTPLYASTTPLSGGKKAGFSPLDSLFALLFLTVGWLFWELQLFSAGPWFLYNIGTALFTAVYAAAVLSYVFAAGLRPPRESWFWLAVVLCLGLVFATPYGGNLLGFLHYCALLFTAEYWTLCVTGRLLKAGRTSNWLPFDILNASLVLPWGNFLRLPAALLYGVRRLVHIRRPAGRSPARVRRGRRALGVLAGLAAAFFCLCLVLPPLMQADDAFAALLSHIVDSVSARLANWQEGLSEFFLRAVFAVPTALFLYGLVYGCVRGRRACVYNRQDICELQRGMRLAPRSTVLTMLGILCAVYLLFISIQAKYLFGAFWGALPAGFSYSEYARQGFFELCRVAAVNIVILLAANAMSRTPAAQNHLLRLGNVALSVLTLLLLATASAKMGLYIAAYGLTVRRVLVSVFLVWMAAVFVLIIARQFRAVSLARTAVFLGAVLFTLLCALPVKDGIHTYNAARVEAGTLAPDAMEQSTRAGFFHGI